MRDYEYFSSILRRQSSPLDFDLAIAAISGPRSSTLTSRWIQHLGVLLCCFFFGAGDTNTSSLYITSKVIQRQLPAGKASQTHAVSFQRSKQIVTAQVQTPTHLPAFLAKVNDPSNESDGSTLAQEHNIQTTEPSRIAFGLPPFVGRPAPHIGPLATDLEYFISVSGTRTGIFLRLGRSLTPSSDLIVEFSSATMDLPQEITTIVYRDTSIHHQQSTIGHVVRSVARRPARISWAGVQYALQLFAYDDFRSAVAIGAGLSNYGWIGIERFQAAYAITPAISLVGSVRSTQIIGEEATQDFGLDLGLEYRVK